MWQRLTDMDAAATAWVMLHRTAGATTFMRFMTTLGSPGVLTVVGVLTVILLYRRGRMQQAATVTMGLAGGWLMNELLKWLFHRNRPPGIWLTNASGYSLPSGHAMVSIAFLLALTLTLSAGVSTRYLRWLIIAAGVLVSLLIGGSRVYLGVHYATDVVAGFAAGAAWALFSVWFGNVVGLRRAQG